MIINSDSDFDSDYFVLLSCISTIAWVHPLFTPPPAGKIVYPYRGRGGVSGGCTHATRWEYLTVTSRAGDSSY
jgi:hypothetical protein